MPIKINSDIPSLLSKEKTSQSVSETVSGVKKLSSGLKAKSVSPSSLPASAFMRGVRAAIGNLNDTISAVEVARSAAERISSLLSRAAGEDSAELTAISEEIDSIAEGAEFGGRRLLNGSLSALKAEVGGELIMVNLPDLRVELLLREDGGAEESAIERIGEALAAFDEGRGRLSAALDNLNAASLDARSAGSRITSPEGAREIAIFTNRRILSQVASALSAHKNIEPDRALSLLEQ